MSGTAGALLEQGLGALDLRLEEAVREALLDLAELLVGWGQRINLTAHRSPEAVIGRLILDALAMGTRLPAWERLVDLGSGAGFPGLPLALAHGNRKVVLVEARERRHHFQRFVLRRLAISNVSPLRGRAEALAPVPGDVVVAQAVAAPDLALDLALRWTRVGGWVALPGAETPPTPGHHPRIAQARVDRYAVPCGGPSRTLWLGQRAC